MLCLFNELVKVEIISRRFDWTTRPVYFCTLILAAEVIAATIRDLLKAPVFVVLIKSCGLLNRLGWIQSARYALNASAQLLE